MQKVPEDGRLFQEQTPRLSPFGPYPFGARLAPLGTPTSGVLVTL